MNKTILAFCLVTLSIHHIAEGKDFLLKKGMSFRTADTELRHDGWLPRPMYTKNAHDYHSTDKALVEYGVKGIEICAVDRPVCVIHYAKKNKCLRLITWGEEYDELKIEAWSHECPSKDVL
jgi:hypothetical protein